MRSLNFSAGRLMSNLCVYCNASDDFTVEHIFSAGLGGSDDDYVLTDSVCGRCNNLFSKLEAELMRKSPVALSRIIMQDFGRADKPPRLQAKDTYLYDSDAGLVLEAKMLPKMGAELVPQIIIDRPVVHATADDIVALKKLCNKLRVMLSANEIYTVEKMLEGGGASYKISKISKKDGEFLSVGTNIEAKAPKNALWLVRPGVDEVSVDGKEYKLHPRFFLHDGESVSYKSADLSDVFLNLTAVAEFLVGEAGLLGYEDKCINQPMIKLGLSFDVGMSERALAKIGLNLMIHLKGAEYVRHDSFANIKSSILTGFPEIPMGKMHEHEQLSLFLGIPPKGHHVMFLTSLEVGEERSAIVFVLQLYGVSTYCFFLSYGAPSPRWVLPNYYLVDYQQHKVKREDSLDYIRKHCSALIQLAPLEENRGLGHNEP